MRLRTAEGSDHDCERTDPDLGIQFSASSEVDNPIKFCGAEECLKSSIISDRDWAIGVGPEEPGDNEAERKCGLV
jgi:hypothetical protein